VGLISILIIFGRYKINLKGLEERVGEIVSSISFLSKLTTMIKYTQ